MRIIYLFFLFLLSSFSVLESDENVEAPSQKEVTLTTVVERALKSNPEIVASEKGLLEAKGLLHQAGLRPNPELQIEGGTSSILGESGDQELSVAYVHTLELGNKRKKRVDVAEIGLMIAGQQLQDRKRHLILEIKKQFAEFFASQSVLEATNGSYELHKKLHEFTVAKVDEGEAAAVEKILSEIELKRLELERVTLAAEISASLSKLRLITGLDEKESIQEFLPKDIPIENLDLTTVLAAAKEKNPQLQISRLEYQQAEAALSLTKAEGSSDLDIFLQYSNEKSRFDAFGIDQNGSTIPLKDSDQILSTGVSFQLPFSRNQGNTTAASARLEQARLRTNFLEKTIEQEVNATFQRYQLAREAYKLYNDSIIKQSQSQLEIMRIAFESGEFRFLDWMNEQKRALDIQKAFVSVAKDYFLAAAELEFLTGSGLKQEAGS